MAIRLDSISSIQNLEADEVRSAATQLEAYFLRRMLAEIRSSTKSELLDGGTQGRVFREMMDEALADEMAKAGGLGIAEMVEAQLKK